MSLVNIVERLLQRHMRWEKARGDRLLERTGWPRCIVEGCETWAVYVVAGEPGQCYCGAHKAVSGKRMVDMTALSGGVA